MHKAVKNLTITLGKIAQEILEGQEEKGRKARTKRRRRKRWWTLLRRFVPRLSFQADFTP